MAGIQHVPVTSQLFTTTSCRSCSTAQHLVRACQVISYSQNLEDVMLFRALGHIQQGFYIDLGAFHPTEDSVTAAFYNAGWSGINVDADNIAMLHFVQQRSRDINLNFAVSDTEGFQTLYKCDQNKGLSTTQLDVSQNHELDAGLTFKPFKVPTSTLARIWSDYVPDNQPVHFLKLDIEGAEEKAIFGNNWEKNRPWIIVIETSPPMTASPSNPKFDSILKHLSYDYVYTDGINRFYLATEHSDLAPAFAYPPNVLDRYTVQREGRLIDMHTTSAATLKKRISELNDLQLNLQASLETALESLQQTKSSLSWRLTAPLRYLGLPIAKIMSRLNLNKPIPPKEERKEQPIASYLTSDVTRMLTEIERRIAEKGRSQ
jgi:FkbM family methyltransferase